MPGMGGMGGMPGMPGMGMQPQKDKWEVNGATKI